MRLMAVLLIVVPLVAAGVVIAAVVAVPTLRRKLPRATPLPQASRPDAAARIVIGAAAVAVLVLTLPVFTQSIYESLGYDHEDCWWWRYAVGLVLACFTLLIVALMLSRYRHRPEQPVAPSHRRIWRSFTTATQLWVLGVSAGALFLFAAFAGSVSSPDGHGRYRVLEIDTGGGGGAVINFFGWAYGIPTAAAAAVLVALTLTGLYVNSARPFLKPATAGDERVSRATLSALMVWFAVGVIVLTLGWAMRTVGTAAGLSLSSEGYVWGTAVAALWPWLFWLAVVVQFLAYLVLSLVIAVALLRPASTPPESRLGLGSANNGHTTVQSTDAHA